MTIYKKRNFKKKKCKIFDKLTELFEKRTLVKKIKFLFKLEKYFSKKLFK